MTFKQFCNEFLNRIYDTILIFFKPLGVTWQFGQMLIALGMLEKPTWKEWAMGTMFILIGGGIIHAGKGVQEKILNKG